MAANRNLFISYLLPSGNQMIFQSSNCSSLSYDHNITATPFSCLSFTKSRPILCDPMDCSTLGFPILHYFPELAHIHVHWLSDALYPSLLLLPSSLFAFNLSQHQALFQWVGSLYQETKALAIDRASASPSVLPVNTQEFISFRIDWFELLAVQGLSSTIIRRHQFFSTQPSLRSNSHIHTWLLEKPQL